MHILSITAIAQGSLGQRSPLDLFAWTVLQFLGHQQPRHVEASEPLAFITLEAALRGKLESVPTYDGSVATSPSGGIPRPSRVLPYDPTASHCWYPDTVLALCDELVPDGSNDSRIPRMSWYRISRLDGPRGTTVATFPNILTGPVTVTDVADSANARNRFRGIIIDSPFSYTFGPSGCL